MDKIERFQISLKSNLSIIHTLLLHGKLENLLIMLVINDDCINCDACLSECPNHAIYEPDEQWSYADGTNLSGMVKLWDGREVDADEKHEALSDEFYYIVPDKCTECQGFHEEPQCAAVCPVDCIAVDENNPESEELLAQKKEIMHA